MKKAVIASMIGIILLTASQVSAENMHTLIGKQVDAVRTMVIDGKTSSQDVVIIKQSSYIPVRAASELFGYDVDYQDGTVLLNKKKEPVKAPAPPAPSYTGYRGITNEMIEAEIERLEGVQTMVQGIIDTLSANAAAGYSDSTMQLLQSYYNQQAQVQMELSHLNGLLTTRQQAQQQL